MKPRLRDGRVVLEAGPSGEKVIPAVYVRRWWWPWTWVRHSYVVNSEAKLKKKTMDLYRQLLTTFDKAEAAALDADRAVKEAHSGARRGWGPIRQMKLGDPEDFVTYDKDAWDKLKPIINAMKSGRPTLSKRSRLGERTGYFLSEEDINLANRHAKGAPPYDPLDNKMVFRPPEEGKGGNKQKGGGNRDQGGGQGSQIPVVLLNQPKSEE